MVIDVAEQIKRLTENNCIKYEGSLDNTWGLVKNISFAKHGQNYLGILDKPIATKTLENEFANIDVIKNIW